jgi:hypothetical protein
VLTSHWKQKKGAPKIEQQIDEEMDAHTYNLIPNVKAGWQYGNEAEELLGLKEFVVKNKKQLMFFVKW